MSTALPDVNLLIALAWPNHQHHRQAREWFRDAGCGNWATCPLTQAGFIRISSNPVIVDNAASPQTARELLSHLTAMPGHRFWPDSVDFAGSSETPVALMQGHRQITDAYLVMLAREKGGCLVTLDRKIGNALKGSVFESFVRVLEG